MKKGIVIEIHGMFRKEGHLCGEMGGMGDEI